MGETCTGRVKVLRLAFDQTAHMQTEKSCFIQLHSKRPLQSATAARAHDPLCSSPVQDVHCYRGSLPKSEHRQNHVSTCVCSSCIASFLFLHFTECLLRTGILDHPPVQRAPRTPQTSSSALPKRGGGLISHRFHLASPSRFGGHVSNC